MFVDLVLREEIIMKKLLIVTAFALSSTVANAACPSGYTSHGPFCAFELSLPVVELPPIDVWTAGIVPVPHTKGPFMEAYGDTTKPRSLQTRTRRRALQGGVAPHSNDTKSATRSTASISTATDIACVSGNLCSCTTIGGLIGCIEAIH